MQKGNFGVSLMLDPPLVSECFSAVNSVNNINCSIKNRLGIGHDFKFEFLKNLFHIYHIQVVISFIFMQEMQF